MWRVAAAATLSAAFAAGAAAQSPDGAARTLRAAEADGGIRLDGRLDEPVWAQAEAAKDFTQAYPRPGAPATFPTEVRVVYRGDLLYVGVRAFDPHPDSIASQLARRDPSGIYSDWINVVIDSYLDRRTAWGFAVNPRGVQRDIMYFDDRSEDIGWDAVWAAATRVDSLGWVAEMRIPLSQLRFGSAQGERAWGLQIQRDVARLQERASWSPWTRETPGFVSRFGTLTGLAGIETPRRMEVVPYVSSRHNRTPGNEANPFYRSSETGMTVGGDLRYGLPAGLTLTATLNPDFGQVEVDPAVVNLTAFETFYPEKRPFFVEGMDIFRFGSDSRLVNWQDEEFFYTRRIGRRPQRVLGGGDVLFTDAPEQSTILGAAKVSGRVGQWSVGVMDALTDLEKGRYFTAGGDTVLTPVEPRTNYLVGRAQRNFRAGGSAVGGMVTATHRLGQDSVFDPLLHESAYMAGVDFRHSWQARTWTFSGYLAQSRVQGEPAAVSLTQRSAARYFQRPDADYVELDPDRTHLGGRMGKLSLERTGPWFGAVDYKEVTPGFVVSDLGFQDRTDYRNLNLIAGRQVTRRGRFLRNYLVMAAGVYAWNFGGTRLDEMYLINTQGTLTNFWGFNLGLTLEPGAYDDRLTRGGPLAAAPGRGSLTAILSSDPRRPFSYGVQSKYLADASGARERLAAFPLAWRPSPTVRLRLTPTFAWNDITGQFVRSVADTLAAETFGRRYVFADVERKTVSLETRLDWTFTRNLSLELFAAPFVASGGYSRFKEFERPGTFDFAVYGEEQGTLVRGGGCANPTGPGNLLAVDPDAAGPAACFNVADPSFNLRSLRGNAVLRWEFRPGSTVFFVWQQQRENLVPIGNFDVGRDFRELFEVPAANVFLVKVTYWIGR